MVIRPCCTVNHGQALPKAIISSCVAVRNSGILHMILVPSSVNTQINGASVSITCDTAYPSSNSLSYTINSTSSFTLSIRIPSWASSNSTVSFDTPPSREETLATDSNSVYSTLIHKGVTRLRVYLSRSIRVIPKPNNAVAIYNGALLYALSTPYTIRSTPALNWTYRTPLPNTTTDRVPWTALSRPMTRISGPLLSILLNWSSTPAVRMETHGSMLQRVRLSGK
jgi:DUF1680 family protein